MAIGWRIAAQLVDTVCMFLCISICNDTSEQHQSDDTYLQSFGISGIYTAVVYSSMAVPVNSGRYYTTMYRTHTVATLLLLSGNRLKRAHILHLCVDKSYESVGTALSAICAIVMATDEHHYLFDEFPLVIGITYRTYHAILAICRMDVVQESYEPMASFGVYKPFHAIAIGC